MTWQVRGGPPPEHCMPTCPKRTDIEITQTRNLDIDRLPARLSRTDLDARHDAQDGPRLGWRGTYFPPSPPAIRSTWLPSIFLVSRSNLRCFRTTTARTTLHRNTWSS